VLRQQRVEPECRDAALASPDSPATNATMNLDSYTRLNPYSDEEKGDDTDYTGTTILMAAGISSVVAFVFVLAMSRT
jgi:hypothetical protein